jgi:hypothetical protein
MWHLISQIRLGTLPDYFAGIGTVALAFVTCWSIRVALRFQREVNVRQEKEERLRQDIEAYDIKAQPFIDAIIITFPESLIIKQIQCREFFDKGEYTSTIYVHSREPGKISLLKEQNSFTNKSKWLILYVDRYGTRRALFGDVDQCLWSGRADWNKTPSQIHDSIAKEIGTGPVE